MSSARYLGPISMARTAIVLDCCRLRVPDVTEVDRIARLHLALTRQGYELRLQNANVPLRELIGLCGLSGVLCVEPGREAEEREQARGVEEERDLGDAPA